MKAYTVKNSDGMYYKKYGIKNKTILWTSDLSHARFYPNTAYLQRILRHQGDRAWIVEVEIQEV